MFEGGIFNHNDRFHVKYALIFIVKALSLTESRYVCILTFPNVLHFARFYFTLIYAEGREGSKISPYKIVAYVLGWSF